jgi:hypothetical protein
MSLDSLVPGKIWHAQQPLKFGPLSITSRMTIVRLQDGSLWVHSPIAPTPDLVSAISALGTVRFVIAPNKSHHLHFLPFLKAFPHARGCIAPGLAGKRPELENFHDIAIAKADWEPELQGYFMHGLPVLNETVWFHEATGTLILTDLLFCLGPENTGVNRAAARLLGIYDRLAMSRTMKLLTKEKAALARSVALLKSLPVERIVLAHDQVIESEPKEKLERALQWLE